LLVLKEVVDAVNFYPVYAVSSLVAFMKAKIWSPLTRLSITRGSRDIRRLEIVGSTGVKSCSI
jgi:hypothetical protein